MPQIDQTSGKVAPLPKVASVKQRPLPAGVVGLAAIDRGYSLPVARAGGSDSTLSVGQGIRVKGKIESCETLVVDGRVEASLIAEVLMVRKGGLFKGTAKVARAEIAGIFTGQLIVGEHLSVKGTGQVSGTIRYHRIAVEDGGRISGDVGMESGTEAEAPVSVSATAKNNVA